MPCVEIPKLPGEGKPNAQRVDGRSRKRIVRENAARRRQAKRELQRYRAA